MKPKYVRILKIMIGTLAIASLAGYVLLSPIVATPIYYKLLFYPDLPVRYDEAAYKVGSLQGITKQDLYIPSRNGKKLHAWFFHNPRASRVVLFSHGNASNISNRASIADGLLQLGVSVLLYDYQGYGLSEGEPSVPNICDDGLSVFDYLCNNEHYRGQDIVLYGESLGCAVACQISKQRQCAGLILQSGFSSLKAISADKFAFLNAYPMALYPTPSLDSQTILEGKHPPLLLIHGVLDETIPAKHSERMFRTASEPKQLILMPNSGHSIAENDNELFMTSVKAFLVALPTKARTASQ